MKGRNGRKIKFWFMLFFFIILVPGSLWATRYNIPIKPATVNIYIDCHRCDFDYIRSEITWVNYVIDPKNADVYVMISRQRTGSGGREYTISFIGQKKWAFKSDTLKFTTQWNDSREIVRRKLVQKIKLGLVQFVEETAVADQLEISVKAKRTVFKPEDRWNYWVFRTSVSGDFSGEQSRNFQAMNARFSAQRITTDWKIYANFRTRYRKSLYDVDGSKVSSTTNNRHFYGMVVKGLSEHWSVGVFSYIGASSYSNTKISYSGAPAVEYDIFPYSESVRKQFRFIYRVSPEYTIYNERTIYGKLRETLFQETLHIALSVKQPWGSIETDLSGAHYFHDFSKNHIQFSADFSFHLIKGFSFNVDGRFSRIHDQLSLPQRQATAEEILLRRRELETQYNYDFSIGIEYTFGSIYNNIVNPRFGG